MCVEELATDVSGAYSVEELEERKRAEAEVAADGDEIGGAQRVQAGRIGPVIVAAVVA